MRAACDGSGPARAPALRRITARYWPCRKSTLPGSLWRRGIPSEPCLRRHARRQVYGRGGGGRIFCGGLLEAGAHPRETGVPCMMLETAVFRPRRADGAEYGAPGPVRRGGALPGRLPPRPAGGGFTRARDAALPLPQLPVPELRKLPHHELGPIATCWTSTAANRMLTLVFQWRPRPRAARISAAGKRPGLRRCKMNFAQAMVTTIIKCARGDDDLPDAGHPPCRGPIPAGSMCRGQRACTWRGQQERLFRRQRQRV